MFFKVLCTENWLDISVWTDKLCTYKVMIDDGQIQRLLPVFMSLCFSAKQMLGKLVGGKNHMIVTSLPHGKQ